MQLATPSHALVVQLVKTSGRPSRACDGMLKTVIESENIIKVGCGLDDDLLALYRAWGMNLQGPNRFDLGGIVTGDHEIGRPNKNNNQYDNKDGDDNHYHHQNQQPRSGLKAVTANVLGLDLSKSKRVSRSNWGRVPLTSGQVVYAARDAWAAAAVADCLALVDPYTFGADVLIRRWQQEEDELEQQLPLDDLQMRTERRRWAKRKRRSLRRKKQEQQEQFFLLTATNQEDERIEELLMMNEKKFRRWERIMAELKEIQRDTAPVQPERIELASYFLMPTNCDDDSGFTTNH